MAKVLNTITFQYIYNRKISREKNPQKTNQIVSTLKGMSYASQNTEKYNGKNITSLTTVLHIFPQTLQINKHPVCLFYALKDSGFLQSNWVAWTQLFTQVVCNSKYTFNYRLFPRITSRGCWLLQHLSAGFSEKMSLDRYNFIFPACMNVNQNPKYLVSPRTDNQPFYAGPSKD